MNVRVDQPRQEGSAGPIDDLGTNGTHSGAADPFNLPVQDEHASMLEHPFAVEDAHIANQLRGIRAVTEPTEYCHAAGEQECGS